jgi:hypothetical protein
MSAWVRDGQAMRFDASDYAPGSAQRAFLEARSSSVGGTVAPVAAPTIGQILDGLPHIKAYNRRTEDAWRDPKPSNFG